nr:Tim44 domain-containing protein [Clostridia bacterium]
MKKRFKLLTILLTAVVLLCSLCIPSMADLGGFSGSSDYGGDYGGGGYDYDYDYGSGFDGGDLFFLLHFVDDPKIAVIIIIAAIVITIIKSKNKGARTHVRPSRPVPGAQQTSQSNLRPMSEYKSLDPNFSEAEFVDKLSNMYVRFQNCWQSKDMDPLRADMTDALYNQMSRQLQQLINARQTNMVENIAVLGVELRGFMQDDTNDTIIASIRSRINDYYIDDNTCEVVRGDPHVERFMTYEWAMIRSKGKTTQAAGEQTTRNCPNCGAALDVNHSAECPYCGSIITSGDHGWVLSSIKGISQQSS